MAKLMRCTVAHYQGDRFFAQGLILPVGHPDVNDAFFEQFVIGEPEEEDEEPKPAKRPYNRKK